MIILPIIVTFLTLFTFFATISSQQSNHHSPQILNSFALGSCNKQNLYNPLWHHISSEKNAHQAFVWLGDVIYADSHFLGFYRWPSPLEKVQKEYERQLKNKDYQLVGHKMPILGIYDDHDYNKNDGGAEYEQKAETQQLFLDFLDHSNQPPHHVTPLRRQRKGAYSAHSFGEGEKTIKLILLDTRYFQNTTSLSLLGEEQWRWFERQLGLSNSHPEDELTCSDPALIVIGSSIQAANAYRMIGEGWARKFTQERKRLLELIARAQRKSAVLLISGDVHYAETVRTTIAYNRTEGQGVEVFPIYEITTSGMTHSVGKQTKHLIDPFLHIILGTQFKRPENHAICTALNYASIKIDWERKRLRVQVKTVDDEVCGINFDWSFDELKMKKYDIYDEIPEWDKSEIEFENEFSKFESHKSIGGITFAFTVLISTLTVGILIVVNIIRMVVCRVFKQTPKQKKQ